MVSQAPGKEGTRGPVQVVERQQEAVVTGSEGVEGVEVVDGFEGVGESRGVEGFEGSEGAGDGAGTAMTPPLCGRSVATVEIMLMSAASETMMSRTTHLLAGTYLL